MPDFLASEKREPRYQAHQHWVMLLLRKPRKAWVLLLVVLAVTGWIWPWPMGFVLFVAVVVLGTLRWRLWNSERLWLTCKRIIHTEGVLETARTESWLRLDRVSGMRITETWIGQWLGYASIRVDAPGDHAGTHNLYRIGKALPFYDRFRSLVIEGAKGGDPDFGAPTYSSHYVTEELPEL